MSSKQFENYYVNQAGNGLAGFEGIRYQKGHGFFGRLINSFAKPLLGYLGKQAFNTGTAIATDVLSGQPFKTAGKRRLLETMEGVGRDMRRKVDQLGTGYAPPCSTHKKRINRRKSIKWMPVKRKPSTKKASGKKKTLKKKRKTPKKKTRKSRKTNYPNFLE